MSDFLFATLDAGGNVPPALNIGRALIENGHRVSIMGNKHQGAAIEASGAEFIPYTHAFPAVYTKTLPTLKQMSQLVSVFTDTGVGADLVAEANRTRPDLVVIDCLLSGALNSVNKAKLPYAVLVHSFYAYFNGPYRHSPIVAAAKLKGMGQKRLFAAADRVLVAADPDLDPAGRQAHPQNVVWSGAAVDPIHQVTPQTTPRVLVSLSTRPFPHQTDVLQRIINAAAELPVELLVTTGPAISPADLTLPPNAVAHQYVPHQELMPTCSAVVGHGGHATTMAALAYGLPMLIIPMMAVLDQPMVGKAVAKSGAGLVLPKKAPEAEIKQALSTILTSDEHRRAAAALRARLLERRGAQVGAEVLVDTVRRRTESRP
jgi:UDP:flavonoid glycosyltransferase YjiC (YdhE family)